MATIKGQGREQPSSSWLGKVRGSADEARNRFLNDQKQREEAGKHSASVILDPRDLQGDYDAARLLYTTLGMDPGESRPMTADDLAAFRRNIQTAGARFKGGGIKARQVLDLSLPVDLEKAREQIKYATPAGFSKGVLRLLTNASGETPGVTRHHLLVRFPLFDVAVNNVNKTPKQAAAWLVKQPLHYDCDCGRHRFWYRYIATIGGFNAGRPETGYPKIRNPNLHGVGCKHALRAMSEIESSAVIKNLLERAITAARDEDVRRKDIQVKQDEVLTKERGEIKSSADRKEENKARQERDAARNAAKKASEQAEKSRVFAEIAEKTGLSVEKIRALDLSPEQISVLRG